jgi:hypothetical protein
VAQADGFAGMDVFAMKTGAAAFTLPRTDPELCFHENLLIQPINNSGDVWNMPY